MDILQKKKGKPMDSGKGPSPVEKPKEKVSPEFFSLILDAVPTPVSYIDRDEKYCYVNKAYLEFYHISTSDVIGKTIESFAGSKSYALVKTYIDRALNGEQAHFEAEMPLKIGVRFIEATYTPDMDESGVVRGFIAQAKDVTEKKRLEKKLLETDSHLEQLLNNLPVAVYTCDVEGNILHYNKEAVEIWGKEPELGKDKWIGWKYVIKDGNKIFPEETPMATAVKSGNPVYVEQIMIDRPDGVRRTILPHPRPIIDSSGKVIGGINILIDITERKIAEEERARLAAIVQSTDDAIISKTLNGIITSWNPAAERLYGYKADEIVGKSITTIIPDDRFSEEDEIIARIRNGVPVEHYETKRKTKDGKLVDVSLTISPVRDGTGKVIGASKIARDITAQKILLEELRENEERLRMAIETTKLGTWEYYPVSKNLSCSKECKRIFGVSDDFEPDNQFVYDHTYPEDRELVKQRIRKAIAPGGSGSCVIEYRIIRIDGDIRWVKAQGKTFFNSNNIPVRFIGTMADITDEKLHEQELKDSVEMFQTMADNVPAMIWMSGDDKFEDYFNKTWLNFRGRTLEQEADEGWLEGVHPDDVQKCIDTYNESFRQQKGFYSEYRLRRYDGEYHWISDNSVPRFSPEGEFLGFISACMDIDDQKRYREKIQDSELLFKTISNASPAALWMTDADHQNIFVSDTWLKWTGKTFEEVIDRGWLQSVASEDKDETEKKFNICFKQRKYFHAEFRFTRKDGEIRWGLTEGYPFYDTNGVFAGYAGSVTDITEIKKLEQRKDDFIKMASHELKTPITSINGYVQLLMNIYSEIDDKKLQLSKATVKSSLHTISKQVVKLTRLISELLDLSKIETGKLELNRTEFDLTDLVEETVRDVRLTTSKHAIVVNNEFRGKIYGDKDRIAQVMMNLLTNAIKYSPDSNQVDVIVEAENENAVIQVKDHGIGIDKKFHQKIFERFYRVEGKSEQTYPGFGIGLFIASEIVNRHSGTISVESEKGKGSVFTVRIPLAEK